MIYEVINKELKPKDLYIYNNEVYIVNKKLKLQKYKAVCTNIRVASLLPEEVIKITELTHPEYFI